MIFNFSVVHCSSVNQYMVLQRRIYLSTAVSVGTKKKNGRYLKNGKTHLFILETSGANKKREEAAVKLKKSFKIITLCCRQ